jgi:uncharacterized protein (UPF0333 family)
MRFLNNKKGQGALEYILIIGGAILIAAIVIAILASTGGQTAEDVNQATSSQQQAQSSLQDLANKNLPCEEDADCPTGYECDVNKGKCTESS